MESSLLLQSVHDVLKEDSFTIPSLPAQNALLVANHLSKWIPEHLQEAKIFENELVASLSKCLDTKKAKIKAGREAMWSAYHTLRTSEPYLQEWHSFLQQAGSTEQSTAFIQFVGHHIFKNLIKQRFQLTVGKSTAQHTMTLTDEETYGLRYAAGYIPRLLKKKLMKSRHPLKRSLLLCLWDLLDEGDEKTADSAAWVEAVNRGGLTRVNNATYDVFQAMELEIRKHLTKETIPTLTDAINSSIIDNDDVQFFWSIVGADWEEECSATLLEMIVSQWVKIRGFSYASAWMEEYKSTQKKTTQKSKGIRKQLVPQPKN